MAYVSARSTPKALCVTAQACRGAATLGWQRQAGAAWSVPKISFIVDDLIPIEECTELFLKADAAMVRLLPNNVALY